jgi:hypothetical protein
MQTQMASVAFHCQLKHIRPRMKQRRQYVLILEELTTEQANHSYCKTAREKLNKRIMDSAVKGEGNRNNRSVIKTRSTKAALQRDTLNPSRHITNFAVDPQDSDSEDQFQLFVPGIWKWTHGNRYWKYSSSRKSTSENFV